MTESRLSAEKAIEIIRCPELTEVGGLEEVARDRLQCDRVRGVGRRSVERELAESVAGPAVDCTGSPTPTVPDPTRKSRSAGAPIRNRVSRAPAKNGRTNPATVSRLVVVEIPKTRLARTAVSASGSDHPNPSLTCPSRKSGRPLELSTEDRSRLTAEWSPTMSCTSSTNSRAQVLSPALLVKRLGQRNPTTTIRSDAA